MTMDSGDESDHDLISTEMLEDVRDGSQTYLNVNSREARYKIRYCIRQRQLECKGALKATQSGDASGSDVYTLFYVFNGTNWRYNYVHTV